MHLVITGGASFLGARLARTLLQQGQFKLAGGPGQPISRLSLVDRTAPPPDLAKDPRVNVVVGDLVELLQKEPECAVPADAQAVIHLASAVSGECEADFDLGMRSNLQAGQRATCPVPPDTPVALSSPARTIDGLLRALQAPTTEWGPRIALNLPALTTTPTQMAAALEKVAGKAATDLIDWQTDPAIASLVTSWPARIDAVRARGLGLLPDTDFEAILRDYVRENPDAVKLALR